jgi:transglutaminase-like putative cysteine protease
MRLARVFLRGAAFAFAALLPVLVRAQFQPPSDQELKMTADPKAPGAAAVYLNIEEIANDPLHYQSYYARIKVLTEKGKELATVEVPYLKGNKKVTGIVGRTIHADGAVIPLTVKPEDLLSEKSGEKQFGRMVFTLPSVDVGSILEYRYELRYDDNEYSSPLWEIQRRYFVHQAHYQFTPFKAYMPNGTPNTLTSTYLTDERGRVVNSLVWWNRLPPGVTMKTSVNGSYSVDVTDVPPIPDEESMPPIDSFLYRVFFYYKAASNANEFWINEGKLWSKDVDKFAEPSKTIRDAVGGIVSPGDSDLDKAKKLYAAVQALDNTDYSRQKSASEMKQLKLKAAKHAEDTWTQKSGSSEDIALLYLAMLRAAGLTAYATKIVDRDQAVFDPSYMTLDQLDTTLVVLSLAGKQTVLDPGEKMCPFGTVNWRHSHASGLGQSAQGLSIATTPMQQYTDNSIRRNGDLTLDAHGGVMGDLAVEMTGQAALRWRQAALRNDDEELKKMFDRDLERIVPEGVEGHVERFLGLDQPDKILLAIVNVKGTLGTATAKRLLLPGFFFATRGHQPFVNEEKRMEPVDMHYGDQVTNVITYHLPAGITVEGAPPDTNISWPGHAMFVAKSKADPGQIVVGDTMAIAFTMAKPEEYQDLRGFFQKVEAAAQAGLVLTNTPTSAAAGKGN